MTLQFQSASVTGGPSKMYGHTSVIVNQNNVVISFGIANNIRSSTVWSLNPSTNSMVNSLPSSPSGAIKTRSYHTSTLFTAFNSVVSVGGVGSSRCFNETVIYQLTPNSLSLGTMTVSGASKFPDRDSHSATYIGNNKLVVIAGKEYNGQPLADAWILTLSSATTGIWKKIKILGETNITMRYGHSAVFDSSKNFIYTIGGVSFPEEPNSDIWLLNLNQNTWTNIKQDGFYGLYHTSELVNGLIYIFCGASLEYETFPKIWTFDPETLLLIDVTPNPSIQARDSHSSVYNANDNSILVMFGGEVIEEGISFYADIWKLTGLPTPIPSHLPTFVPTSPTLSPTDTPSLSPTVLSSNPPSNKPTLLPTLVPTKIPTLEPTLIPSVGPTLSPTNLPTFLPTVSPSFEPTTPTSSPSYIPSQSPSIGPSHVPTKIPTSAPTSTNLHSYSIVSLVVGSLTVTYTSSTGSLSTTFNYGDRIDVISPFSGNVTVSAPSLGVKSWRAFDSVSCIFIQTSANGETIFWNLVRLSNKLSHVIPYNGLINSDWGGGFTQVTYSVGETVTLSNGGNLKSIPSAIATNSSSFVVPIYKGALINVIPYLTVKVGSTCSNVLVGQGCWVIMLNSGKKFFVFKNGLILGSTAPTMIPTFSPSALPTLSPSNLPSRLPTKPTSQPTSISTTAIPTNIPSNHPTSSPTSPNMFTYAIVNVARDTPFFTVTYLSSSRMVTVNMTYAQHILVTAPEGINATVSVKGLGSISWNAYGSISSFFIQKSADTGQNFINLVSVKSTLAYVIPYNGLLNTDWGGGFTQISYNLGALTKLNNGGFYSPLSNPFEYDVSNALIQVFKGPNLSGSPKVTAFIGPACKKISPGQACWLILNDATGLATVFKSGLTFGTVSPSMLPTNAPIESTRVPTMTPTISPTIFLNSTQTPSSVQPTSPSHVPSRIPTNAPSNAPSLSPTLDPTQEPTFSPSFAPSKLSSSSSASSLSIGAIVGIIVGCVAGLLILLVVTLYFHYIYTTSKFIPAKSGKGQNLEEIYDNVTEIDSPKGMN